MVYEPEEDSYLIRDSLPKDLTGLRVLDMGCGSGILGIEAAKRGGIVTAVDVDDEAIKKTSDEKEKQGVKITVKKSNLFSNLTGEEFDLIICNPPYLPNEPTDPDIALDGGREGWEFISRFLNKARKHLNKEGKIILLYSSRTNPEKVRILMETYGFEHKIINEKRVGFFEKLYVEELIL